MTDTTPLTELRTQVLHQISLTKHRPLGFEERDWLQRTLRQTFDELARLRACKCYPHPYDHADTCPIYQAAAPASEEW